MIWISTRTILILICMVNFSACSTFLEQHFYHNSTHCSKADFLFHTQYEFYALSNTQRQTQFERLSNSSLAPHCSTARLKLAILLTHPDFAEQRGSGADTLLAPCLAPQKQQRAQCSELATLLSRQLNAQQQVNRHWTSERQTLHTQARLMTEELEHLRSERITFQQQLDALKAIEHSIRERDKENQLRDKQQ